MHKGDARVFLITVAAIFGAGLLMNTLRDNSIVQQAIVGFEK